MLHKKMFRDLRLHSGQFVSIFLLSLLAVCLFTGVAGEVAGVERARAQYHEQTNLADGWIYGTKFTEAQVGKIAALDGVREAQKRMSVTATDGNDATVFLYLEDKDAVNCPMVLEGEAFDPADGKSIWLAKRFAAEQDIALGDNYTLSLDSSSSVTLRVAGLIWSPEYEYYKDEIDLEPDYHDTGYAFASTAALPRSERQDNQIVYTAEDVELDALESEIAAVLHGQYSVMLRRNGIANLTAVDDELQQHKMMAVLFPAFFVIIAMLTTVTTMKRIVDRQRTQIGTLKALGMKRRKIYLHYLSYGFVPALAGALLGTLIGPLTLSPMLFRMKYYLDSSDEYMLPKFGVTYPFYFWLLGLILVLFCVAAAWLSCRRILQIRPAEALRPAQPKNAKKTVFERLPFWEHMSFPTRYNLRDIARNKARTIFGLAGTVSCMALLLCGFAAKDNFQNAVTDLYANKLLNHASMITIQADAPIAEAERVRDLVDGELVMSATTEIRLPGSSEKRSCHMNVYEDSRIANVLNERLETVKLSSDDFTVTVKTAALLGIHPGDTVEWHVYGSSTWTTSEVTRLTRAPFEQGIVTTRQVVEQAGYSFTPTRLLTRLDVDPSFQTESAIIDSVTDKGTLAEMLRNYLELINLVMGFMLVLAILLAAIVLYSLGLLSFEERQKELAALKVLGFGTRKLRGLMLRQNILLAVLGALLGIPLGMWMLRLLIRSLGDSMDIPTSCGVLYVLIAFVITMLVSIAVNLLFTKRIRTMNMVEEIKNTE